jgi:hypothetical protein
MRKGLFLVLVLVLVVVLVLDVLGLCGKKGVRSVMILFDRSDRETPAFSSTSTTTSTSTSTKGQPRLAFVVLNKIADGRERQSRCVFWDGRSTLAWW